MKRIRLNSKTGKYLSLSLASLMLLSLSLPGQTKEVTQKYNGLTLNANLEMAEGKDFSDGMVLILHGLTAHNKMEIVSSAQQVLLDNERSSLAINLSLGIDNRHGFHGCDRPHRHIQDNAVGELSIWVAWLRGQGVRHISMLGHSRGANQIMVYAVEAIDPEVKQIVLMAPGASGTEQGRRNYLGRYGKSVEDVILEAKNAIKAGKGNQLMKMDLLLCAQADSTPESFLSYWLLPNKFAMFREYLSKSPVPTLVIVGSADERQPNSPELLKSIENDLVNLEVIDGAGHFFRDLNMDEAIEIMVAFFEEAE